VDAFNALRKSTYGELAVMPHQNPAAMLPADFADRFFQHTPHTGVSAMTSAKDVQARIDTLKKETTYAEARLADLQAKAAEKEALKKAKADAEAAVREAKKTEAEAKQKTREAEKAAKEADKKMPPTPPAPPKGIPS